MSKDFDPYYKWLGIPPTAQPPNHYRLLGIELFEADTDVISDAAEQRMAHVRTYQLGQHMALSQRMLNELAAAKSCLLNPEKKAKYDQGLRARLTSPSRLTGKPVSQDGTPFDLVSMPFGEIEDYQPIAPLVPTMHRGVPAKSAVEKVFLSPLRGMDRRLRAIVGKDNAVLYNLLRVLVAAAILVGLLFGANMFRGHRQSISDRDLTDVQRKSGESRQRAAQKTTKSDMQTIADGSRIPLGLDTKERARGGREEVAEGAVPFTADLHFSEQLNSWQIVGHHPNGIRPSKSPINEQWVEPQTTNAQRMYGVLHFSEATKVNVILDVVNGEKASVRFAMDDDVRFDNKPAHQLPYTLWFTVSYPGGTREPFAIEVYYVRGSTETGAGTPQHLREEYPFLGWYPMCLREGVISIEGDTYPIAISLISGADYSKLENVEVLIRTNQGQAGAVHTCRAYTTFKLAGHFYLVAAITHDGSTLGIKKAGWGELKGRILDSKTRRGISGATLSIHRQLLSAKTGTDGHFDLKAPQGLYGRIDVTAEGYIPKHDERYFAIAAGIPLEITEELTAASGPKSGAISLHNGDSYHFLAQKMFHDQGHGGDFYFSVGNSASAFCANNLYQKGIVDLGNIDDKPLDQVVPPANGYNWSGVAAIVGHTYVSLAKEGEDGHYIIFRVTSLGHDDSVEIQYYYGGEASREKAEENAKADREPIRLGKQIRAYRSVEGDAIRCVAFSPDGGRVLTGHLNCLAIMWDMGTSEKICDFKTTGTVCSVAFSPDGKRVFTGSAGKMAGLWDAGTGVQICEFTGHSKDVHSVAFNASGKQVLTGSFDKTAVLWDVKTGKKIRAFKPQTEVLSVAFSPDGKLVLTGCENHTAVLWNADTGEQIRTFNGYAAAFSRDGKQVLTAPPGHTAILWDLETGTELRIFAGHSKTVSAFAFSPDGKRLVTGSYDSTAILWNVGTGEQVRIFKGHIGSVNSVAFSPDGTQVLTGSEDGTAILWDADQSESAAPKKTGGQTSTKKTEEEASRKTAADEAARTRAEEKMKADGTRAKSGELIHAFKGNGTVAFSPDGKRVLAGGMLWEASTGKRIRVFEGKTVAFSPDGKRVLTASGDKTAVLWDADTGKQIHAFRGDRVDAGDVECAAFSRDGKQVVIGSQNAALLWDANTGEQIGRFWGLNQGIRSVAFSPDGKTILIGSFSSKLKQVVLWDADTRKQIRVYQGHGGHVTSVAFSPDGGQVLIGSTDKTAILRDTGIGRKLCVFKGHGMDVTSVAFSPDGRRVLTGSKDGTAILWDAYRSKQIRVFTGHKEVVTSVAFSPDGKRVLTGSLDVSILWDANIATTQTDTDDGDAQ